VILFANGCCVYSWFWSVCVCVFEYWIFFGVNIFLWSFCVKLRTLL
jgi:hypothetical protein